MASAASGGKAAAGVAAWRKQREIAANGENVSKA